MVRLISPDAKPLHQIQDQPVIIFPDLVTAVLLRFEIAHNAKLVRMVQYDARPVVRDTLGDHDMGVQALLLLTVKMDEAAHCVQKPPGNGQPKPKPSRKAAAAGICLVKDVIHLQQLGIRHPDTGITDIYNQVDAVLLLPVSNTYIDAALLRKLDGVFHQDFEHMRNFLCIPDEDRRHIGIDIKYQLQMLPVALQCGHCDHIVKHRGNHIFFL